MNAVYVNGEPVDPTDVAAQRERMEAHYRETLADSIPAEEVEARLDADALDNVIDDMLLRQAADASKLFVSDREVKQELNRVKQEVGGTQALHERTGLGPAQDGVIRDHIRTHIRVRKYLARLNRNVPRPSDQECREIYDRAPEKFVVPEMVLASQVVQTPDFRRTGAKIFADMMNIRQALLDGADFEAVSRLVSGDPDNDGNLGYLPRGKMVPAFDQVIFALEPGEVSDVFQTEYGYHLVKVFDRRPEEFRAFPDVLEFLREELWDQRRNHRIGEEADALRKAGEIRRAEDPS